MSVNDARGPSIDSRIGEAEGQGDTKKGERPDGDVERLAHRGCNTRKGAVTAVVPWPDDLFVVDPAPIITAVERLQRKGGRELMARCPTRADADAAAAWLVDRISQAQPRFGS